MSQEIIIDAKEKMDKVIEAFKSDLAKISTGYASTSMLDGISIDYYGTQTPLNQTSSISVDGARQLVVKPFDKSQIELIKNAINSSKLGFNANDTGDVVRINIPQLTEETRIQETKKVGSAAESAKIAIRQIRQDANSKIKNSDLTDDFKKDYQDRVQNFVSENNEKIDMLAKEKEKHILEI